MTQEAKATAVKFQLPLTPLNGIRHASALFSFRTDNPFLVPAPTMRAQIFTRNLRNPLQEDKVSDDNANSIHPSVHGYIYAHDHRRLSSRRMRHPVETRRCLAHRLKIPEAQTPAQMDTSSRHRIFFPRSEHCPLSRPAVRRLN